VSAAWALAGQGAPKFGAGNANLVGGAAIKSYYEGFVVAAFIEEVLGGLQVPTLLRSALLAHGKEEEPPLLQLRYGHSQQIPPLAG